MNPSGISFLLLFTSCLFLYLLVNQCSNKQDYKRALAAEQRLSRSYKDSLRDCQTRESKLLRQQSDALLAAERQKKAVDSQLKDASDRVAKLTLHDQKKAFVKAAVKNQSLSTVYLVDTAYVDRVIVDSVYVQAALESAEWVKIYKQSNDSLSSGLALVTTQLKDCTEESGQKTALINKYNADCGGFFQQLFCRRCRELKREVRKSR